MSLAFILSGARAFRAGMVVLAILLALVIGMTIPFFGGAQNVTFAADIDGQPQGIAPTFAPPMQDIPSAQLTPELIASLVTIVFSLAFAYLPGLKTWYGARDSEHKAAIMGLVIILVSVGSFGAACGGFIQLQGMACSQTGAVTLVQTVVFALLSSVGSYTLLVKPFQRPDEPPDVTNANIGSPYARRG